MARPTLLTALKCGDALCSPKFEGECSDSNASNSDVEEGSPQREHMMHERIRELGARELEAQQRLEDFDHLWKSRREPLERGLQEAQQRLQAAKESLEEEKEGQLAAEPPPPGPASMSWVDSKAFDITCGAVVVLNLAAIGLKAEGQLPEGLDVLDHLFLSWYILELAAKLSYHRSNLLCGRFGHVWSNWLDLGIVVGGVALQWLLPLFVDAGTEGSSKLLGLLRLFRLLRVWKLLKLLFQGEMGWTEGARFQMFMTGVIAFNAVLMALELDHPWRGWDWVENALLCIYLFELAARMKHQGCAFFYNKETLGWNYLDTFIVAGAALDLWMFPILKFASSLAGKDGGSLGGPHLRQLMSLLRLMRLIRILRLVKLMKAIKPLYRLLSGVVVSLKAMQWVMLLCMLMLYAAAIFWTTVVGKGLIYSESVPKTVDDAFGTVPRSFFSLFRMMNGDTDMAEDVFPSVMGQVFFVVFMVTASWAVLAILTSVVSDNMIAASQKSEEEEEAQREEKETELQQRRLKTLFEEFDLEGDGIISEVEWRAIMDNPGFCHELVEVSGSSKAELEEAFRDLAIRRTRTRTKSGNLKQMATSNGLMVPYGRFIKFVQDRGKPADRQHVLKLLARLEHLEGEVWRAARGGSPSSKASCEQQPASCRH